MQQHRTAAPGAPAVISPSTLDAIRAIVVEHGRTAYGLAPTDGETGGAGTVTAAPGAPSGGDPLGLAPAASTSDSTQSAPTVTLVRTDGQQTGQAPAPVAPPAVATPPAPAPAAAPPAGQQTAAPATAVPTPPPAGQQQPGQQQNGTGTGAGPLSDAPLESFPPEIRDYIRELRKENGDARMKAKNADTLAAEAAAAAQKSLLDGVLRAAGLITDADGQATTELTPEQRLEQATTQVSTITAERDQATTRATNAERELAIWQQAHDLGANPKRLTDSRTFMQGIGGLDPAADDYNTRLAAAIGAAVESDPYYRNAPVGQVPPALPAAPSGGDFGGGPAQQSTTLPTDVDGFRELLRKDRAERR